MEAIAAAVAELRRVTRVAPELTPAEPMEPKSLEAEDALFSAYMAMMDQREEQ